MNKKRLLFIGILCLMYIFPIAVFSNDTTYRLGLSKKEYAKLVEFRKKALEVKSEMERNGGISSAEVKKILGKPEAIYRKNEEELSIRDQKEIWMYWHPCYVSVRFLLVFDKNDKIVLFTAVQCLHPKIGNVYYDVDYFLDICPD